MEKIVILPFLILFLLSGLVGCLDESEKKDIVEIPVEFPEDGDLIFKVSMYNNSFAKDTFQLPINLSLTNIDTVPLEVERFLFDHSYEWSIVSDNGTIYRPHVGYVPLIEWPDRIILQPGDSFAVDKSIELRWFDPFGPYNIQYLPVGNYSLEMEYFTYSKPMDQVHYKANTIDFEIIDEYNICPPLIEYGKS